MILTIVVIITIFTSVVMVHELGHFWAAKRAGVTVEEFGIGFPPRAASIKRRGTVYSLNWLPLGGFVRMKGETDDDLGPGTYNGVRLGAKVKILLAGVAMNFLLGYLLLTWLAWTGLPPLVAGQIKFGQPIYKQAPTVMALAVAKGSPAEAAGITQGTLILSADGRTLSKESDLTDFTKSHAGQTVSLETRRAKSTQTKIVRLKSDPGQTGYLGVTPLATSLSSFGWRSPLVALVIMLQLIWRTLAGFGALVIHLPQIVAGLVHRQPSPVAVAGPVGIVEIISSVIHLGLPYVLVMVFSITLSLGVINALPIPPLDGGQLAIAVLKQFGLGPRSERVYRWAGLTFVVALVLLVTIIDLVRI